MKEAARQFDWRTYWANPTPFSVILKKSFEEFVARCDEAIKPVLTDSQEIAFYNVIDKRCDKAELLGVTPDKICQMVRTYTEKFILNHSMSASKKTELRTFCESICGIYNKEIKL